MDPDATVFVAQATAISSGVGAIVGSGIAFVRRLPVAGSSIRMGVNCAVAGALFFGSREFIVSPLLVQHVDLPQYQRRRAAVASSLPGHTAIPAHPSVRELRSDRLLDSMMSGSFTGAILNTITRGPPGVLPGLVTGGLLLSVVQFATNELKLARIRFVGLSAPIVAKEVAPEASRIQSSISSSSSPPFPGLSTDAKTPSSTFTPASSLPPNASPPIPSASYSSSPQPEPHSPTLSERLMDALTYVSPIKKLTPEEYAVLLERKRLQEEREATEEAKKKLEVEGTTGVDEKRSS